MGLLSNDDMTKKKLKQRNLTKKKSWNQLPFSMSSHSSIVKNMVLMSSTVKYCKKYRWMFFTGLTVGGIQLYI